MFRIFLIISFVLLPFKAFALIEVDITRGNLNPLPIAVSPLSIDETSGFGRISSTRGDDLLILDAIPVLQGSSMIFEGATADAFETTISVADPTADRTITFADESGTVITTGAADAITEDMMANDAIGQNELKSVVTLQILNSSGTPLKTLYAAGA